LLLQLLAAADGGDAVVLDADAAALQDFAAIVHGDQPAIGEDETHSGATSGRCFVWFILPAIMSKDHAATLSLIQR
jgi:uncharacterized membrane protein